MPIFQSCILSCFYSAAVVFFKKKSELKILFIKLFDSYERIEEINWPIEIVYRIVAMIFIYDSKSDCIFIV